MVSVFQLKKRSKNGMKCLLLSLLFVFLQSSCAMQQTVKNEQAAVYDGLLKTYGEICDVITDGQFEAEYASLQAPAVDKPDQEKWNNMLIYMNEVFHRENGKYRFAYALSDLNQDGRPELLTMLENGVLFSLFTTVKQTPVFVDAFWAKHRAAVQTDGTFITFTTASAEEAFYTQAKITETGTPEAINIFGYQNGAYYTECDNIRTMITEKEYRELVEQYNDFSEEKAAALMSENHFSMVVI